MVCCFPNNVKRLSHPISGLWTRGDSKDYEAWANLVDDNRWSWSGLLPHFRKTETHYDPKGSSELHGHNGPVYTASVSSSGRNYPLREPIKAAWTELGLQSPEDSNGGHPLGIAETVESRSIGQRVIASAAYPLNGVTVLSSTLVKRIMISSPPHGLKVATGVETTSGKIFHAKREVIVSAGAFRTPQLLLLSGVGAAAELSKHGIKQIVESPEVGKNLWDQIMLKQHWRLRDPSIGAAVGHSKWTDPAFLTSNPCEWNINSSVPTQELKAALQKDGVSVGDDHELLKDPRCHVGFIVYYVGAPYDGSTITTFTINLLPTARGTVTLASTSVDAYPVIDPNHYSTETDRYRLRTGVSMMAKSWTTEAGKAIIQDEVVPEGSEAITADSGDDVIDARLETFALEFDQSLTRVCVLTRHQTVSAPCWDGRDGDRGGF